MQIIEAVTLTDQTQRTRPPFVSGLGGVAFAHVTEFGRAPTVRALGADG